MHGVRLVDPFEHGVGAEVAVAFGERVDRCLRERVHGVAADQRVDVERGGVRRVLRRRRRPQRALHPRALRRERVPARAGERREELLVRELGVGDRGLARATRWPSGSRRSVSVSTRLTKNDATDARCEMSSPAATRCSSPSKNASITCAYRSRPKISVTLTLIPAASVAAIAGMPSSGGRDLDHHVGPVEPVPELLRLARWSRRCRARGRATTSTDTKPSAPSSSS